MNSFLALVATRLPDPVNMQASGVKISCRGFTPRNAGVEGCRVPILFCGPDRL